MTAPVIPAPAAPAAPATPAPIAAPQSGAFGVDEALRSIAADSVKAALAESGEPQTDVPAVEPAKPAEPQAREDGALWNTDAKRWVKDGKFVAGEPPVEATPVPANGEPATEPAVEQELKLPEGYVATKKVEGRELATAFKVLDESGELEVPDLKIEFNANGKTRIEPLDKVVKMAQWGVYNQEREQQVTQAKQHADMVGRHNEQLVSEVRSLRQERERLLSDPDFLVQTLAQFEQQNTPEAKLDRERQENQRLRQEREFDALTKESTEFFTGELQPAVETIVKALPLVSDEEIGAKLLLISDRYKTQTPFGNIVLPKHYPQVRQAMLNEIVPWAQQVHDAREQERKTALQDSDTKRKKAEEQTRTAQVSAQKAKSLVGRVTKPIAKTGSAQNGTTAREAPTHPPIRTVDDAERAALRDALAATLG